MAAIPGLPALVNSPSPSRDTPPVNTTQNEPQHEQQLLSPRPAELWCTLTILAMLSCNPNTRFNSLPLNQLTAYVFWATAKDSPPILQTKQNIPMQQAKLTAPRPGHNSREIWLWTGRLKTYLYVQGNRKQRFKNGTAVIGGATFFHSAAPAKSWNLFPKLHKEKKCRSCIPQLQRSQNPPILAPSGSTFLGEFSEVCFQSFLRGLTSRNTNLPFQTHPNMNLPTSISQKVLNRAPRANTTCKQSRKKRIVHFRCGTEQNCLKSRNKNDFPFPEILHTQFLLFLVFAPSAAHHLQPGQSGTVSSYTNFTSNTLKTSILPTIPVTFQGSLSQYKPGISHSSSQLSKVKHKLQPQILPPCTHLPNTHKDAEYDSAQPGKKTNHFMHNQNPFFSLQNTILDLQHKVFIIIGILLL